MTTNDLMGLKAMAFDIIRERDALQRQTEEKSAQLESVARTIAQLEAQMFAAMQEPTPEPTEAQPE